MVSFSSFIFPFETFCPKIESAVPQKLNIELPYDPAILLRWNPKELETGTRSGACAPVFKYRSQEPNGGANPQSPPTDEAKHAGGTRHRVTKKTKKSYSALRENEDRYGCAW